MNHTTIKPFKIQHSKFKILLLLFAYLVLAKNASAQGTNYDRNSPAYRLLERLEIKSGNLNNQLFLDGGPVSRINAQHFINKNFYSPSDTNDRLLILYIDKVTKADTQWINYIHSDNQPWGDSLFAQSRRPILKYFYRSKANLYEVNTKDFYVSINPVLAFGYGKETASDDMIFRNTRGVEIRGQINKKLGFYTYLSENQVGFPSYIEQYYTTNRTIPDVGLWKRFKTDYTDFFNSRAYITFSPTKNIHMQFGNDKNFIGSGFRSLLLSDFAKDYLQFKINTRVWRFQYQNIFAEMINYETKGTRLYPKKYAAMHYLSFDAARWLNFGVFEGIMFFDIEKNGRGYDFNYLNPVIFYRSVEHNLGSPDNALVGANMNALIKKRVKLVGQIMFDELKVHELIDRDGKKWWGNKYALQAGFRWIDFLGLPNVDIQSEFNLVRPYTFTGDTVAKAYEHFKQSLTHPMGANLREFVNIIHINTFYPVQVQLKYIITQQGLDTGKLNYGSNIFISNESRPGNYNVNLLQGLETTTTFAEITASYMLRHNLFIDANVLMRSQKNEKVTLNTTFFGAGLRLNFTQPDYTF